MSNLNDAIKHLENAEEHVNSEASIDMNKRTALLAMADRIQQCRHDLQELAKEEENAKV